METLKDIISDIRVFLYGGIRSLPLTIAGTMLLLGAFTANYAMIFFLVGYVILTPTVAFLLNLGGGLLFEYIPYNPFKVQTSDTCNVVIPYLTTKNMTESKSATVISSEWLAMISFFFSYLIANAVELYSLTANDSSITVDGSAAPDITSKITNRTSQAMVALCTTIVVACIIIGYRYMTQCETLLGTVVTMGIFGGIGYGWYKLLSTIGQNRLSDMFGIANRLLSPSAMTNAPIACVPIAI